MKFSVLMSIYYKEKAEYFNKAMQSIWDKQIVKPNEIILVQDGELTDELYLAINEWNEKLDKVLKLVPLKSNIGLALALNEGLKHCIYGYIARMDTDDISTSNRFKDQVKFLDENKNIDVCGMYIREIDENGLIINKLIKYPLSHNELFKFFKKRNPFAHPTVMFRKSYFNKAGLYSNDLYLAEDTLLWYNGFLNNCLFANINRVGLEFRRTNDMYYRRSDFNKALGLLKSRLFLINRKLNYGLISDLYSLGYFVISISPNLIKKIAYKSLR
ncbi:MAG: glycosyltransferase [Candidatus Marinimicrobia bacterium]|nr:glycosyltransferase [Candidatus Neomarinimicrobiota bacterium]